jgi:hypothetical protein
MNIAIFSIFLDVNNVLNPDYLDNVYYAMTVASPTFL